MEKSILNMGGLIFCYKLLIVLDGWSPIAFNEQ